MFGYRRERLKHEPSFVYRNTFSLLWKGHRLQNQWDLKLNPKVSHCSFHDLKQGHLFLLSGLYFNVGWLCLPCAILRTRELNLNWPSSIWHIKYMMLSFVSPRNPCFHEAAFFLYKEHDLFFPPLIALV